MELLDDALARFKERIIANPHFRLNDDDRYRRYLSGKREPDESVACLRLDWELAADYHSELGESGIMDLMLIQVKNDLEDLIENGDIYHTSDPLFKVMDGSKKRGQEPVEIEILYAYLIPEDKKSKGTTEYTLFLTLYVKWA